MERVRKKYFSFLSCSSLQQLSELYKMDLELFDYDISEYKALCQEI